MSNNFRDQKAWNTFESNLGNKGTQANIYHTCPIHRHNEIVMRFLVRHNRQHKVSQSVPHFMSRKTVTTSLRIKVGGHFVMSIVKCYESHCVGVLDNPHIYREQGGPLLPGRASVAVLISYLEQLTLKVSSFSLFAVWLMYLFLGTASRVQIPETRLYTNPFVSAVFCFRFW